MILKPKTFILLYCAMALVGIPLLYFFIDAAKQANDYAFAQAWAMMLAATIAVAALPSSWYDWMDD